MVELFANSGDPDQMPSSAVSDLGLHCLAVTCLGVSRLNYQHKIFHLLGFESFCQGALTTLTLFYFLGKIRKVFQNAICSNFYPAC